MSALTDRVGFRLSTMVEAQRGMTTAEVIKYLNTGVLPDLSQPPVETPGVDLDTEAISLEDARTWLSGRLPDSIVAAGNFLDDKSSHSENLHSETTTFKFNPNQPRDKDGQWTRTPGSSAPNFSLPSGGKAKSSTGKKVTPAIIYKKHADGTVVGTSSSGDQRMRWNADAKKYTVETRQGDSWQETAQLTKTAAYNEMKQPDRWFDPGDDITDDNEKVTDDTSDVTPNDTPPAVDDVITEPVQTESIVTTPEPPLAPEPVSTDSQPTAEIALPDVTITESTPVPSTASTAYVGPKFEYPEDIDFNALNDARTAYAQSTYFSNAVDSYAAKLRQDNPDKYGTEYGAYQKAKDDAYEQLRAQGLEPDPNVFDDAYSRLMQSMSHHDYKTQDAIRARMYKDGAIEASFMSFADRHELGKVTPKLKRDFAKKTRDLFAGKKIAVRVTPKNLEHILNDGRIKTQFETGKSKAMNNQEARAKAEQVMFGIDPAISVNPEKRPVYGYVAIDGIRPAAFSEGTLGGIGVDALSQYGQIQIVLKDDVRDRTTAMFGDSLNHSAFGAPSPINQPSWMSFTMAPTSGLIHGNLADVDRDPYSFELRSQTYVEAQIHDGVQTSDIAEVVFPANPSAALKKLLDTQQIPWRVLTLKSAVQSGSDEEKKTARLYAQQQIDYVTPKLADVEEKIVNAKSKNDNFALAEYEKDRKNLLKLQKAANDALEVAK